MPKNSHVVFIAGENEYKSEASLPGLAAELQERPGFRCTVLIDKNLPDAWRPELGKRIHDIPNLQALEQADLAVLYLRFRQLPEEQLAHLQRYLDAGKPLVAFRTTTHAFNYAEGDPLRETWNSFGARVLGAPWIHHYGHESSTDVTHVPEATGDPILEGVAPAFHVRSWLYQVLPDFPPPDARPLLLGTSTGPSERKTRQPNPVAWTRTLPKGNRVFTTTLGHPEDFPLAPFRKLVMNGIQWALGRD